MVPAAAVPLTGDGRLAQAEKRPRQYNDQRHDDSQLTSQPASLQPHPQTKDSKSPDNECDCFRIEIYEGIKENIYFNEFVQQVSHGT